MNELLDRYGGLVYSLARRFCYEPSEVDDAVQDVFVAIWQSAERYDQTLGTEDTFVSMLARRRLIDRRRRTARRREGQVDADVGLVEGGNGSGTESSAEQAELVDRAARFLAGLRPEQQECLRLSIYQGLSHDEIARATGIPLGTVKTHVRRGLIALREALFKSEGSVAEDAAQISAKIAPKPVVAASASVSNSVSPVTQRTSGTRM